MQLMQMTFTVKEGTGIPEICPGLISEQKAFAKNTFEFLRNHCESDLRYSPFLV